MADGPVAEALLRRLEAADGGLDSAELAAELGVEHQALVGTVKSLQALGEVSRTRDAWSPGFGTCSSRVRRALTPGRTASGLGRVNCMCSFRGVQVGNQERVRAPGAQTFLLQETSVKGMINVVVVTMVDKEDAVATLTEIAV